MSTEWDDTPWGGEVVVPDRRLVVPDVEIIEAKAAIGPGVGFFGPNTVMLRSLNKTPQDVMKSAQHAYANHPWIYAAEHAVTVKVAGLPWHLEDENDEEYEAPLPPQVDAATNLLEKPQGALAAMGQSKRGGPLTRRELITITSRHLGLCNLAHWYLDQREAMAGTPLAILYINPARMWAAEDANGNLTGWVLDPKDNTGRGGIPLDLSEVMTFYLDPPDWGHYGHGLYERAVIKAQISNLADQHASYVLGTGGRIAGIVSPKEGTIPDEKFAVLVNEFRTVNEAPDAAKRTTILQGPVDFTQTAANPEQLNLVELSKMTREDIFVIWDVPGSQAAIPEKMGLNSGNTKSFDEAALMQGPVHERVGVIKETIQYQLLDRWQSLGATIDLEIDEPGFDDETPAYDRALKAVQVPLKNIERREIIGLPPFGDGRDEEVWLPNLLTLVYDANGTAPPPPPQLAPFTGGPPAAAAPPFPVPPAGKASQREFLGLRKQIDTRWVPRVKTDVGKVLRAQKGDVVAKMRSASPAQLKRHAKDPDHWFGKSEDERLARAISGVTSSIGTTVVARTKELLKAPAKADTFVDTVLKQLAIAIGLRVVGINDTTRAAIGAAILDGFEQGLSPAEIADNLEGLAAFDEYRAELIARTESMFAYNAAALTSYGEYGVEMVEPIDGDQDEECLARLDRGAVTLEEALADEDHPNGTLDWVPVFNEQKQAAAKLDDPVDIPALIKALLGAAKAEPVTVQVFQSEPKTTRTVLDRDPMTGKVIGSHEEAMDVA